MVINNILKDSTVKSLEETIIAQNPELDFQSGEIDVKFIHDQM